MRIWKKKIRLSPAPPSLKSWVRPCSLYKRADQLSTHHCTTTTTTQHHPTITTTTTTTYDNPTKKSTKVDYPPSLLPPSPCFDNYWSYHEINYWISLFWEERFLGISRAQKMVLHPPTFIIVSTMDEKERSTHL